MRRRSLSLLVLCCTALVLAAAPAVAALDFTVDEQSVELHVYEDWSVQVWYTLAITTTEGPHNGIYLGIPDSNICEYAASSGSSMLLVEQTTYNGGDVLKIYFPETAYAGDTTEILISFWAFDRIFPDETDDTYQGVYFIPATWDGRAIAHQSVTYILPAGVTSSTVKFTPNPQNMAMTDRLEVYYERSYATPESFATNVLFPASVLVPEDEKRENPCKGGGGGIPIALIAGLAAAFVAIIAILVFVAKAARKGGPKRKPYQKPELSMESLGVRKDLDTVEAAVLLDAHPVKIVNLIVLGLVKKGKAMVDSWGPLTLSLIEEKEHMEDVKCPNCGAPVRPDVDLQTCDYCGSEIRTRGRPTYYENQFLLHALTKGGTLDEKGLTIALTNLSKRVAEKMRGYNRKDSAAFYEERVASSWGDVKTATDEEKYRVFGEDLGWLMLDKDYDTKVDETFGGLGTSWTPASWWVWYNLGRASSVGGREFADKAKVTNSTSDTRFGIKSDKLKAAIAAPVAVAHAHKSGCACACVNCACACACVSCACACAGGGGF